MINEHFLWLQMLTEAGRLADYCVWPKPDRAHPAGPCAHEQLHHTPTPCRGCGGYINIIRPLVRITDRETGKSRLIPPHEAFPLQNYRLGEERAGKWQPIRGG